MFKKHTYLLLTILIIFSGINIFAQEMPIGEIVNVNYQYKIAFTDLSNLELKEGDIVEIHKEGKLLTYMMVSKTSSAISKLVPIKKRGVFETKIEIDEITVGSTVRKVQLEPPVNEIKTRETREVAGNRSEVPASIRVEKNESNLSEHSKVSEGLEEQLKMLSENYSLLSESLSELMKGEKKVEKDNVVLKDELLSAQIKIDELTLANANLRNELEENNAKLNEKALQKKQNHIEKLESTINLLKSKLVKMANILKEQSQ